MAKNLGLMAKIGSGCLATLVSLVGIDAAQALDFTFSWDSTINSTGTSPSFLNGNPGTATGSFSLDGKSGGQSFVGGDMSDISITINDGRNDFTRTSADSFDFNLTQGNISNDGSSIEFTRFALVWTDSGAKGLACFAGNCSTPEIRLTTDDTTFYTTSYATSNDALASITANVVTASPTPVPFGINPNSGILIVMGLWGTNTLIKRKKHSQSINS